MGRNILCLRADRRRFRIPDESDREFRAQVTDLGLGLESSVTFFVIAIVAAVLGFSGIAGTAVNLAWICAVIGIIFAVIFGVMGRRPGI